MASPDLTAHYTFERDRPPEGSLYVIILTGIFFGLALLWASWAELDQISRAEGRVIPAGKTQQIQSAEAGVVTEILVRPGEHVRQDQLLIRLDDTNTSSSAGAVEAQVLALSAKLARLQIESTPGGDEFDCSAAIEQLNPEVCASEMRLFQSRQASLAQSKEVLSLRAQQRETELAETRANIEALQRSSEITNERLELIAPMAERGLVAQTEFLDTRAQANDLSGRIAVAIESERRLELALSEANSQMLQADLQFQQEALAELTLAQAELASAREQLRGATDRVSRTDIRSPVDGIISSIEINTIGAVVGQGTLLLDVVPTSDELLVEARLPPADIAFIIPGQEARIKLTAYDFAVFGGLTGRVTNVSADSIVDPDTRETYYRVEIVADTSTLDFRGEQLPVLPGMVTNVDVLTGRHTVLQYILGPILRAQNEALRER